METQSLLNQDQQFCPRNSLPCSVVTRRHTSLRYSLYGVFFPHHDIPYASQQGTKVPNQTASTAAASFSQIEAHRHSSLSVVPGNAWLEDSGEKLHPINEPWSWDGEQCIINNKQSSSLHCREAPPPRKTCELCEFQLGFFPR